MNDIPVVMFYHNMDRQSCSAPTNCFRQINQAWSCATTLIAGTGYTLPTQTGATGGGFLPPPVVPPTIPPPPLPPPPPPRSVSEIDGTGTGTGTGTQ